MRDTEDVLRTRLQRAEAKTRRMAKLLQEARSAIAADLTAVGPDEVRQHPVLRSRQKLVDHIERALPKRGG